MYDLICPNFVNGLFSKKNPGKKIIKPLKTSSQNAECVKKQTRKTKFTKTSILRVRSKYGFIEVEITGEIFFNKRRFFAQEIFLERDTFK